MSGPWRDYLDAAFAGEEPDDGDQVGVREERFWQVVEEYEVPVDLAEHHLDLACFDLFGEPGWGNVADHDPRDPYLLAMKRIQSELHN